MAKRSAATESGSTYFLKILLYFILGTIWIKIDGHPVLPAGLIVGLAFASQEHFQIDRKVEYAVLLISALLAFSGLGIFINL